MNVVNYTIPESQLFRLLDVCSNHNYCTPNHKEHCVCIKEALKVETVYDITVD